MFTCRALLYALALLLIVAQVTIADNPALRIRQAPGASSADPASSTPLPSSNEDTRSTTVDASSGAPTDEPTSNESAQPSRTTVVSDQSASATSSASTVTSSATSSAAAKHRNASKEPELPLTPELTPALGVAGVIMLLSGIALTFVGVRIKRLHIFISVAYLGYTGLIVLIAYVCDPPINPKFQGLYFFAAFATGAIIGGGALFFTDITEGLGCPLGGFAFAMWLLVLKSGGTMESEGGKIGLICGFTAAAWCLSFSQYTRYYGLIVCEAFAGSTITMLGIDCFSRAGLKEFWLYVWNLNDQVFPLGTTTYPMTRGIKAEIAGIVIFAVFGGMSQSKLWKVVKERREKKAAKREKDEEDRDHLEADLGKRLEEQNDQDRNQWEVTYGNKEAPVHSVSTFQNTEHDSTYHSQSNASFKRSSVSLKGGSKKGEVLELGDLGASYLGSDPGSSGAGIESKDKSRTRVSQEEITVSSPTSPTGTQTYVPLFGGQSSGKSEKRYVVKDSSSEGYWEFVPKKKAPSPEVPPLPFTVPKEQDETEKLDEGDAKSIATAGESNCDPVEPTPGIGLTQRGIDPHERSRRDPEEEKFAFGVPHVDDDHSSVAATMDGLTDDEAASLPKLSRSGSPLPQGESLNGDGASKAHRKTRSVSSLQDEAGKSELTLNVPDLDASRRHSTNIGEQSDSWLGSLANLSSDKTEERPDKETPANKDKPPISRESKSQKARGLTKDALPEAQSNTTQLYRTNEWAKHSVVADTPMADDLAPPSEPGIEVKYGAEAAAPVNVDALRQTAFTPQPPVMSRNSSSSNNPYRAHSSQSKHSLKERPSAVSRNVSSSSIQSQRPPKRAFSNPNASGANFRSSSTNLLNQPVPEEDLNASSSSNNPYMLNREDSNVTLMGQRQDRMQNRISTMSFANPEAFFTPNPSNPNLVSSAAAAAPNSTVPNSPVDSTENTSNQSSGAAAAVQNTEDQTLAQRRKTLIQRANSQQQQSQQPEDLRHSKSAGGTGAGAAATHRPVYSTRPSYVPSGTHNPQAFDSHQPQRGSTVSAAQRESRLAQWHADMAADQTSAAHLQRRSTLTGAGSPAPGKMGHTQSSLLTNNSPSPGPGAGPSAPVGSGLVIDARRAQMQEDKRRGEVQKQQSKRQKQEKENAIDAKMRSGDMLEMHREKMRRMQKQALQGEGEGGGNGKGKK
ncbi:MAG: hypothetical protein M1831_006053 [Alyxoria varia]|nr:MAG: hypothetical protein M1831_006053 [Alyxoria varia]